MSKLLSHGYAEKDEARVKPNLQGRWHEVSRILCFFFLVVACAINGK